MGNKGAPTPVPVVGQPACRPADDARFGTRRIRLQLSRGLNVCENRATTPGGVGKGTLVVRWPLDEASVNAQPFSTCNTSIGFQQSKVACTSSSACPSDLKQALRGVTPRWPASTELLQQILA